MPLRLLSAAAAVFCRHGLAATQATVAKEAGVGVATIYRRFPTKDDLIYEVYRPRLEEGRRQALKATQAVCGWDGLIAFIEESASHLVQDRGLRELVLGGYTDSIGWSRNEPSRRLADLLRDTDAYVIEHLSGVIDQAKADGDLRRDFEVTDVQLVAAMVQVAADFGGREVPELHRRGIGLIVDAMRASRAEPTELPVRALTQAELARLTARAPR